MGFPVKALVVGAGQRSLIYASYAQHHPDELQIVAVADPNEHRRKRVQDLYGLPSQHCFETAEEAASRPKLADVAINGTMDHQHVATSLPLLQAGYDLLLEKPFAVSEPEMWKVVGAARAYSRKVLICHVLRFASFYSTIRRRVLDGAIGDLLSVQTAEHVTYHHVAVSYVRGRWAQAQHGNASMLMSKCSHDLDLIAWMKSGIRPRSVASFGSNLQFRPDRAPAGAGTRCMVDCDIEPTCIYSARAHYIERDDRRNFPVWDELRHTGEPTPERKIAYLKGDTSYGRCVWKSDMDVVDHQSVAIGFEDGSTATHNMVGGTAKPMRSIRLVGTRGEIQGVFEDNRFSVRHIDPRPGHEYSEELVDLSAGHTPARASDDHGGGDLRLVEDFLRVVRGEAPSISTTSLDDSVTGHLIGFSADRAMAEHRVIELPVY